MERLEVKLPTRKEAEAILTEASQLNPGPWVQHSINVAKAAQAIASYHPQLSPEIAFIFGYLHDIGRREGVTIMRHTLDGYNFLLNRGFEDAARICLTHCFPVAEIYHVAGKWDCSDDEFSFVKQYISSIKFTAYDRLIQLCDALALSTGFCLIEKRLVDVALRHGVNEYTLPRWKAYFDIQQEFENKIGCSIYQVLPGVIENTFGFRS